MEVDTALVPNEFVGYHKTASYNRNGRKHYGKQHITIRVHFVIGDLQILVKHSTWPTPQSRILKTPTPNLGLVSGPRISLISRRKCMLTIHRCCSLLAR